jgi:antitoxin ParD1/3/4
LLTLQYQKLLVSVILTRRKNFWNRRTREVNVSLTVELEKIVAEKVASGHYASASEVVREALRLLYERDQLKQLRQDVQHGIEQLDHGSARAFDTHTLDRIKRVGRKQLAAAIGKARRR